MLPTTQTLFGTSFINTTPGNYNQSNVVFGGPASWLRYSPARPKKGALRASYSFTRYIEVASVIRPGTFANVLVTVNVQQTNDPIVTPALVQTLIDQTRDAAVSYGPRLLLGES